MKLVTNQLDDQDQQEHDDYPDGPFDGVVHICALMLFINHSLRRSGRPW